MTRRACYALLICCAFLVLMIPEGEWRRAADFLLIGIATLAFIGLTLARKRKSDRIVERVMWS